MALEIQSQIITLDKQADIDALKAQYAGGMNAINYIATVLEGDRFQNEDMRASAIYESLRNIVTAAIEHPLADAIGEYNYSLNWANEAGVLRLKSEFGYLDEIIESGAFDTSGQIPEYEKKRNLKNLEFLHTLTEGRQANDINTYVEFSPTPLVSREQLAGRGYKGNDTILVYELDDDGVEQITQYWFPKISIAEWGELLKSLGREDLSGKTLFTDLDIMTQSGSFNEDELAQIMSFVRSRRGVLELNKSLIQEYTYGIEERIFREAQPILLEASNLVYQGQDIQDHIFLIEDIITRYQLDLILYINSIGGNTPIYNNLNHATFVAMTAVEQMAEITRLNFIADGCGFGDGDTDDLFGNFSSIVTVANSIWHPQLHQSLEFPDHANCSKRGCPGFYVKNGDSSTYCEKCPVCGTSARC